MNVARKEDLLKVMLAGWKQAQLQYVGLQD